jgi:hypothetical protein
LINLLSHVRQEQTPTLLASTSKYIGKLHCCAEVPVPSITGGGATLKPGHKFYDTARLLVDLAIEANENGDYFPVSEA